MCVCWGEGGVYSPSKRKENTKKKIDLSDYKMVFKFLRS